MVIKEVGLQHAQKSDLLERRKVNIKMRKPRTNRYNDVLKNTSKCNKKTPHVRYENFIDNAQEMEVVQDL